MVFELNFLVFKTTDLNFFLPDVEKQNRFV